MKLFIPKDIFDNPKPPRMFLCTTGKKIIGELPAYEVSLDGKWGAYSETSFSIDRQYVDILTGETKPHPLFDKAEGLRKVYMENLGYFIIQDPENAYADKDSKTLSCFSTEYETGNKYLENFHINTGEIDSKEVIYLESIYGTNYTIDQNNLYKKATGAFDAYESYFVKNYTDVDSYIYEQREILNASDYLNYDGSTVEKTLYIKSYPNVRFYFPTKPELSLINLIFDKLPGWKIGNVDTALWRKERTFSQDRIAAYDFLMNDVQDTFKCVVEWDTLTNTVNFYEEAEDGINEDDTIQTHWDTDVYISRENLASEIKISYSTDDIKTKLKVSGSDDLDIREVNLGQDYIMNLSFYHTLDWMEPDLFEAYDDYLKAIDLYSPQYTAAMQGWVGANNKYHDIMNAVPVEGNVVLIGDAFEKLYCIYTPINTAYLPDVLTDDDINTTVNNIYADEKNTELIDKSLLSNNDSFVIQGYRYIYQSSSQNFKCESNMTVANLATLKNKLELYQVNKDTAANKSDNILLRLENSASDTATIRIYYDEQKSDYMIKQIVVRANSGLTDSPVDYTLEQWINGGLIATQMGLDGFTVKYIGVMGAYFVLAKDEKVQANLQDYGVNLLTEKHKTYTTIFETQIEAMYAQDKYQCIASDESPTGNIAEGTKWLDTDSSPIKMYEYTSNRWVVFNGDLSNYENYQRYIDNYEKLQAVQEVLVKKEREARYCSDGYVVPNRKIVLNSNDGSSLEGNLQRAAESHFEGYTVARKSFDATIPLYTFTTSFSPNDEFVVYLKGTTPYVSYSTSQGVYQAQMDRISKLITLENFFTEDQWIRLSPFIREDEFSDSNFLLNGYESEEEKISIFQELKDSASKTLKTLCQPSLKFSMNMANILAFPEFKPLVDQFQLGNFVRVHIRDNYIKRTRLLNVHLQFDDLSDFSCDFGNLVTTKSEIDKHAELLQQAVTAGKQVATSAGDWQKAVDKSNKLEEDIANGLTNAALEIGKAAGQSIVWDEHGIWGRKLVDGTTDRYEDEQFRIINNKLVFSNDGFKTSKAVFGSYTVNGETRWGPLAEYVTADTIEGKFITGGSIEIGTGDTKFIVNEDGSVEIKVGGQDKYASTDALKEIDNAYRFRIVLSYDKSTVFSDRGQDCTITCSIYDYDIDITNQIISIGGKFSWIRVSSDSSKDADWNAAHIQTGTNANKVKLDVDDVERNSQFSCSVDFDETKITI